MLRTRADGDGCKALVTDLKGSFPVRPSFLPDGRRFVYNGGAGSAKIFVGDLDTQKSVEVLSR
jgi:hypothetical protein